MQYSGASQDSGQWVWIPVMPHLFFFLAQAHVLIGCPALNRNFNGESAHEFDGSLDGANDGAATGAGVVGGELIPYSVSIVNISSTGKEPLFGKISDRSVGSTIPNHCAIPYHIASKDNVGMTSDAPNRKLI